MGKPADNLRSHRYTLTEANLKQHDTEDTNAHKCIHSGGHRQTHRKPTGLDTHRASPTGKYGLAMHTRTQAHRCTLAHLPVCAIEQYGLDAVVEGIHPVEASCWDVQAQPIGPQHCLGGDKDVSVGAIHPGPLQPPSPTVLGVLLPVCPVHPPVGSDWLAHGPSLPSTQPPCDPNPCRDNPGPHISFFYSSIQQIFDECLLQVEHSLAFGNPEETKATQAPVLLEPTSHPGRRRRN